MDKYKIDDIFKRDYELKPTVKLKGASLFFYVNISDEYARKLKLGDEFRIIHDKDYVHAAYIAGPWVYLPSGALLTYDGERNKFLKSIPGIRNGSLDSLRLRIALARAVRAQGMKPSFSAVHNLEKIVRDANAQTR